MRCLIDSQKNYKLGGYTVGLLVSKEIGNTGVIISNAYCIIVESPKITINSEAEGVCEATLGFFKDQESRIQERAPIAIETVSIDVNFIEDNLTVPKQAIYDKIKLLPNFEGAIDVFEEGQPL